MVQAAQGLHQLTTSVMPGPRRSWSALATIPWHQPLHTMHDHPDNLKQCLEYLVIKTEDFRQHLKSEGKSMDYSDTLVATIAMLQEELNAN